jgi:hypothetical protein
MNDSDLERLRIHAAGLDGVLTMSDLRVLFGDYSEAALFKKLEAFVREHFLVKVKPGVYALPTASLAVISQRLAPRSYVSTGTVLAKTLVIGSIPARRIQAIKVGRPRYYRCALGVIEHLSVRPGLFFGYETRDGLAYATPEKAFLDVCYLLSKGRRFSFDPVSDVQLELLDSQRILDYLAAYDRRFITFFRARWSLP